ncbi:MAG: type II secretion system GspH family protein [Planctomycetaceae bacterium]|nr:type II secretion system GspH family protein [Planctomycetaceae bacterium]
MTPESAVRRQRGFTLLEITIVVGILSIFAVMVVPPIVNALALVNRESAILRMDRDGHQALNLISSHLRPSVLPIVTRPEDDLTLPATVKSWATDNGAISFQDVLNSEAGFEPNGQEWLDVLQHGTDFLPFTQPVPFLYTANEATLDARREKTSLSTLDSNELLQLGLRDFTTRRADGQMGAISNAGTYTVENETLADGTVVPRRYLRANNQFQPIHPYLQNLTPQSLSLDPACLPDAIDLNASRFAADLTLPANANTAYGIIRFVPFRDAANPNGRILDEATLGPTKADGSGPTGLDIDGNGSATDTFALGRLEIVYLNRQRDEALTTVVSRTAAGSTVLLRLNTVSTPTNPVPTPPGGGNIAAGGGAGGDDPEPYPAIFRLRTPRETDDNRIPSYAIDIDLLLMDDLRQQRSVLSFNKIVPFIVRRYQTTVELRNLTRF